MLSDSTARNEQCEGLRPILGVEVTKVLHAASCNKYPLFPAGQFP